MPQMSPIGWLWIIFLLFLVICFCSFYYFFFFVCFAGFKFEKFSYFSNMMMNLFAVFDPVSVFGFHFNWVSIFWGFLFFPIFLFVPSHYHCFWLIVTSSLFQKLVSIFQKSWKG